MRLQAYIALGWSPIFAVAADGARRVEQIVGWDGGVGTAPATGMYIGSAGFVTNITDGVDIRGAAGGGGGAAISAGANSQNTGTVNFANSNNITFGLSNNGTLTASFSQSNQDLSLYALGNTTQNSSTVLNASKLSFNAIGNITMGFSNGSIQVSQSNAAGDGGNILAAGTRTAGSNSSVLFSNANGVTFGLDTVNGSIMTASVAAAGGAQTGISGIILSNTTYTSGTVSFRDGNGISWASTTGQGISITHALQYTSQMSDYQSIGAYLTTAAQSTQTFIASLGGNTGTTNSSRIGNGGFVFAGGNGVTINQSNNSVSWSVATAYQSQGAYLTTAAQSTETLMISLGGNTATTNSSRISNGGYVLAGGNGVTIQQSNNSVSLSVATNYQSQGAYLTTAALSTQTLAFSLSGNTATTNSSQILNGGYALAGGNGVTLQQSNNTVSISVATNYQSQGAYLTTAALSQDSSKYAGTGVTTAGGAGFSATLNTAGLSVSIPAWLTTADLSANSSKYIQNWKLTGNTAGTTSSAQGTDLWFSGGNSITVSGSSNSIVFSVGNYITTARASTDAIGLNTAQSNVTWTVNSSGLSLDARGYAGTGTTFNGANISGSITQNSLGVQLSMSVAAPGAAAENNWHNLLGANTAGNTTASGSTIGLSGINITLSGTNNSQIVISAAAQSNQTVGFYATGNTTQNSSTTFDARTAGTFNALGAMTMGFSNGSIQVSAPATSSLSGTGQVSISVNGSTISIGVPNPYIYSFIFPAGGLANTSALTWGATSLSHAAAFNLPEQGSFSFIRIPALMTTNSTTIATMASATASAQGALYSTINAVAYSLGTGASSKSLQSVASGSGGYTMSQKISITNSTQASYTLGFTAEVEGLAGRTSLTTQYSVSNTNYSFTTDQIATQFSSVRFLDIPFANSLSAGPFWMIIGMSTSSSSAGAAGLAALTNCNVRYSAHYGMSQADLSIGIMGSTNRTSGGLLGVGSFSTAGGGTTNSLDISAISSMASQPLMYFQLLRSA